MYLLETRERERERERSRDLGRTRSRLPIGIPNAGLNPRTPGSQPEPKADAQPLSHPGAQILRVSSRETFLQPGVLTKACRVAKLPLVLQIKEGGFFEKGRE